MRSFVFDKLPCDTMYVGYNDKIQSLYEPEIPGQRAHFATSTSVCLWLCLMFRECIPIHGQTFTVRYHDRCDVFIVESLALDRRIQLPRSEVEASTFYPWAYDQKMFVGEQTNPSWIYANEHHLSDSLDCSTVEEMLSVVPVPRMERKCSSVIKAVIASFHGLRF